MWPMANFTRQRARWKEKLGHLAGKPDLENEGRDEHDIGKVQEKVGQVEEVFEK